MNNGVLLRSAKIGKQQAELFGVSNVREWEIKNVLKVEMDYRFRHLKDGTFQDNSQRCLVLRQQFSHRLLNWAAAKPRLINIDETWLNMCDFRRDAWISRLGSKSIAKLSNNPRIALIVALDNHGELYWAMNQINTNKEVMCLFLRWLVTKLNQESRNWRQSTVVYFDGAPYHDCKLTLAEAKALGIPLAIMAPYSYDTAPCELLFAEFKREDVNPERLPTGKG